MKLSRFTIIGMVAVGVLLLAWGGLMLFSGGGSTRSEAVVDEYHCPNCGRELPKAYVGSGECPYCKAAEQRGEKVPKKAAGRSLTVTTGIPAVLVVLFAGLLTTHLVLIYRSRAAQNRPDVVYYVHCNKCGRKLRYREAQVGKLAACPLCRKPIVFPKPPAERMRPPWWKRPWPRGAAR